MPYPRRSRPPGWYPDPEDPTRLRQWDGTVWSGRYRLRPAWSVSSVEFSPRLEAVALDERPSTSRLVKHGASRRAAAGAHRPLIPERAAGAAASTPDPWAPSAKAWRYNPFTGLTVFLAVAVVVLAVTTGLGRPRGPFSTLNTAFATRADTACTTSLTAIHSSDDSVAVGSLSASARVDLGALRVEQLATEMGSWPEARAAGPGVQAWLDRWHRYASERHRYAELLRASVSSPRGGGVDPPTGRQAPGSSRRKAQGAADHAASDAAQADEFALTNGLQACTLLTRAASPSLISVP